MLFGKYLAREWLNPTSATPAQFAAFVKKHGRVMLKPACDGKGHASASMDTPPMKTPAPCTVRS